MALHAVRDDDQKPRIAAKRSLTVSVEEAAEMIGISRTGAYDELRTTGQLIGIRPLRVGRRMLIPRAPLMRALGEESERDNTAA